MKNLFTLFISLFVLTVHAQVGTESQDTDAEELNKSEESRDAIAPQSSNANYNATGILSNYQQFNSRKQSLINSGNQNGFIQQDSQLNLFMNNVAEINANSHEFNMMQYWLKGKNLSAEKYLLDAYRLDPNNAEGFDEVLEYANWKSNAELELEIALKIKQSSKYEQGIYEYSKDLMKSLPSGAVLITSGEVETITSRVIQLVDGLHKDITVLRKDWLDENRYSEARLKELGLEFNSAYGDLKPNIQNLIESNANKDFFLSLTLPKSDFSYMADRLFLIGLAYKYSSTSEDNIFSIENNWEKVYSIKKLNKENLGYYGKKLMSNYLLSGVKLHQFYTAQGKGNKAKKLKETLFEMAEISGHIEKIKQLL